MRALLSVSDKAGLADFARGLAALNCELISTGGTAKALAAAGLAVISVSDVTGSPEMMDGRVKTLHPKIHGGILARRALAGDMAAIAAHGITPIDIVVVNLYPFKETAKRPDVTFEELVEHIDIGGPSLVRAAAKNFRDVLVVVEPGDYQRVLKELGRPDGPGVPFRLELAVKAFCHTEEYDHAISRTLVFFEARNGGSFARRPPPPIEDVTLGLLKDRDLRYGENPHQKAALFNGRLALLQGKALSYTNLLDLDAAQRIAGEFAEPAAVVVKHTNPCGVATGSSTAEAYVSAREADALSAFGGIVGLNRPLDAEAARAVTSTFIEAVVAPAVAQGAREVLGAKPNMRVVTPLDSHGSGHQETHELNDFRSILGGVLMQERDWVTEARDPWPKGDFPKVVTKRQPTEDEWQALRFAWRVCAHVKSNAVIFAGVDRTLGIGAGQMSRVDAVRVATMKAGGSLTGSVAASDAFFPFRDGLDHVAAAGATAVVQPGGSVRDAEVIAAADEHGLAMVFTGIRHFRH
ncbi:MAG: bifunctional phosphoribosylaminoimidazolecarboxamide formyltransferase/IMP cyclohydrolase [Vicinamibacterales bacterium]